MHCAMLARGSKPGLGAAQRIPGVLEASCLVQPLHRQTQETAQSAGAGTSWTSRTAPHRAADLQNGSADGSMIRLHTVAGHAAT